MKDNDIWLTPPNLLNVLGKFDLDPCAPMKRLWPTAKHHYTEKENGLIKPWFGRVWCNPPYSEGKIWTNKFLDHANGLILMSATSPGSPWLQRILKETDGVFFFKRKLKFYFPNSIQGRAYLYNLLGAIGKKNLIILKQLPQHGFDGVLMYSSESARSKHKF